ncbi:MAG: hypothetical protein ACJ789_20595 [Thermomicrobiales bacterium]
MEKTRPQTRKQGRGFGWISTNGRTPLELKQVAPFDSEESDGPPAPAIIERLEGEIARMPLVASTLPSAIRYFLDGSQRTYDVYFPGYFPMVFSVCAAAILERDPVGSVSLVPGTLELRHTWFVPEHAPRQPPLVDRIKREGMSIVDPLERYQDDDATYAIGLSDYNHIVETSFAAAKKAREQLETDILTNWAQRLERASDAGWIVVDGALRVCPPRAVGLVKSFTKQHLTGSEATALYDLPAGCRTSAFRATDRYRSDLDLDGLGNDVKLRTLWYMRLHDATGKDGRHGLIRIETSPNVTAPAEIDTLSSWLMNEKHPRASADARWANLLYPVHMLERMLKQYVDRELGARIAKVVR